METSDRVFKIEKQDDQKTFKLKNDINIKTNDNLNIQRKNEKLNLSKNLQSKSQEKVIDKKPHLTSEIQHNNPRPKLIPMDGLNLLSNQRKMSNEKMSATSASAGNSSESDADTDNSIRSNDSDDDESDGDVKNNYHENLYTNNNNNNRVKPLTSYSEKKDSRDRSRDHDKDRGGDESDSDMSVGSRGSRRSSGSRGSKRSVSSRGSRMSESSEEEEKKTYEDIQREKQFLLFKLERLEKQMKIKIPRRYTLQSNFDDIKNEHDKLKRQRDVEKSIKFQRKALMGFSSGTEYLNRKFDPIDAKLDGWSESVMENIEDYDEVFEELHDKYGDKMDIAPELKLLMMVGGSAFMFHLTNTIFKSSTPGLNDILKQNPDIMRSISEAAIKNMNAQHTGSDPFSNMMRDGVGMKAQQYANQERNYNNNNNMNQHPNQNTSSTYINRDSNVRTGGGRMSGPVGVDDILNDLEEDPIVQRNRNNNMNNMKQANSQQSQNRKPKPVGINIDI